MDRQAGPMNLVMFLMPTGRAWSWRNPDSPLEQLWTLGLPARIAQRAEEAKFDALFIGSWLLADSGGIGRQPFTAGYEPFTLMGALAARTERIGLIGTASTTFEHPFNLARMMASADWLSNGRAGWNVVTSVGGAQHYGLELPPNKERYARAQEYLDVTNALWDAWEDDAVVNDRENATWAAIDRIHPVSHAGDHFRVEGQLFMHRSPQGRPVIVQAGQSPAGLEFAARNAEVVFTAQHTLDEAKEFYDELKGRAESAGRSPSSIRILPGIMPLVADSIADLEALEDRLDSYLPIEDVRELVASKLQADLTGLAADEPIPADRLKSPEDADIEIAFGSRYRNFYELAINDRLTLRRVAALIERNLGHFAPRGTTAEVADELQSWYEAGACDGFAFTPVSMPDALDSIYDLLMPELRRRGLAREFYDGLTLRDHLGLKRPASPAAVVAGARQGA